MKTIGTIVLEGASALEFWRTRRAAPPPDVSGDPVPPTGAPDFRRLEALGGRVLAQLSAPLDVCVATSADRRSSDLLTCHVRPENLPDGAFAPVASGVYVASPVLCFVQMAGSLPFAQAVALGCELCGLYGLAPDGADTLLSRPQPLVDVSALRMFAEQSVGLRGRRAALHALRYVLPRSASPMETVLGLLLSLPCRYGGFGLPAPELNCRIDLGPRASALSGHGYNVVDFLWRQAGVAGEYDGRSVHAREQSFDADRLRANALKALGIELLSFTARHVRDDGLLRCQVDDVARRIGFRQQPRSFDERERRMRLRSSLLEKAQGSAKPVKPGLRAGLPSVRSVLDRLVRG